VGDTAKLKSSASYAKYLSLDLGYSTSSFNRSPTLEAISNSVYCSRDLEAAVKLTMRGLERGVKRRRLEDAWADGILSTTLKRNGESGQAALEKAIEIGLKPKLSRATYKHRKFEISRTVYSTLMMVNFPELGLDYPLNISAFLINDLGVSKQPFREGVTIASSQFSKFGNEKALKLMARFIEELELRVDLKKVLRQ
jgi:hypothetical protein